MRRGVSVRVRVKVKVKVKVRVRVRVRVDYSSSSCFRSRSLDPYLSKTLDSCVCVSKCINV